MERKFLVVSFTSEQKYTGGIQCSKRNVDSVKALFGEENVIQYIITPYKDKNKFSTKLSRVLDIFSGYMGGLNPKSLHDIHSIIINEKITDLFVDSSLLGLLCKYVKRKFPYINVFTFFHNYEYGFIKDALRVNHDRFHFYWPILALINEKAAIKYADKIICLNERDSNEIVTHYGRKPDILIPITLKSEIRTFDSESISGNKNALFVGSYFFGNVQGLKWFCHEVLPYTDIHLTIVGASMDKFQQEIEDMRNISIHTDVPDLRPFFDEADFVILPILSGSGMKVKTAESLMNGKFILGTDEAFRGYEITEQEGIICNSASEFIDAIAKMSLKTKFNEASRKLYEEKYSFEASLSAFKIVLD